MLLFLFLFSNQKTTNTKMTLTPTKKELEAIDLLNSGSRDKAIENSFHYV